MPRVSLLKYDYDYHYNFTFNLCIGTATTLVNGHEPVSYETLKFCGSFLQIHIVKMKGP